MRASAQCHLWAGEAIFVQVPAACGDVMRFFFFSAREAATILWQHGTLGPMTLRAVSGCAAAVGG